MRKTCVKSSVKHMLITDYVKNEPALPQVKCQLKLK